MTCSARPSALILYSLSASRACTSIPSEPPISCSAPSLSCVGVRRPRVFATFAQNMSTAKTTSGVVATSSFHAANVRISPRVNEKLPALSQILSAHDVAPLTRRNRWVLYALSFLGRFPRKQRFRGHSIGWDRVEILEWLTPPKPIEPKAPTTGSANRHPRPNHACLWRGPYASCRMRRRRRRHRSMGGARP